MAENKEIILFLDFDGVLHPAKALANANLSESEVFRVMGKGLSALSDEAWSFYFLEEKMSLIEDIIDATNCKIVISSDWRYMHKELALQRLSSKITSSIIGYTEILPYTQRYGKPDGHRDVEEQLWMKMNRPNSPCFAIDDEERLFYECAALYVTNPATGIVAEDLHEITERMKFERSRPIESIQARTDTVINQYKKDYPYILPDTHNFNL